ncbi:MAG TPA: DUF2625 domain-containing protein [Flavisolibacter sp.]|nr:DUF2625 domain-containing protein [Flavisolibacter sp.]
MTLPIFAQNKMRPLDQVIGKTESGWTLVQEWIDKAKNKVEVLPCDTAKGKDALYKTQVTTRSPMGAIIYSTGGLLIDGGRIRVFGSGSVKLNRTLRDWNKGKSFKEFGEQPAFLLVADVTAGGFFAVNDSAFGNDAGKVYCLSPDNMEWEAINLSYTEFLNFCFNGDLADFYKEPRWNDRKTEMAALDGSKAYNFFPFLWTKEGEDINKVSRKPISVEEQFSFTLDMRKQFGLSKNGL